MTVAIVGVYLAGVVSGALLLYAAYRARRAWWMWRNRRNLPAEHGRFVSPF